MMYFVTVPAIGSAVVLHDGVEGHEKWQVLDVQHWPQTHAQAAYGFSDPKLIVLLTGFAEFGLPQRF